MILIGDLYQLPPVVTGQEREIFRTRYDTPYFFSAKAFDGLDMDFIELEKVYRQSDDEFIRLLNAIRNRTVDRETIWRSSTGAATRISSRRPRTTTST